MALLKKRLGYGFMVGMLLLVFIGFAVATIWKVWRDIHMHQISLEAIDMLGYLIIGCLWLVIVVVSLVSQSRSPRFNATATVLAQSLDSDDDEWEDEVVWPRKSPRVSPRW